MKRTWYLALLLMACVQLLMPANLRAGDKDAPDKKEEPKKEEPKKEDPKKPAVKDLIVNGELINADLKDKARTGSFCKTYTFKMIEGKSYQIDMRSTDFDSYLRLEDPEGMQVAADDDSGGFPNAR